MGTEEDEGAKKGGGIVDDGETPMGLPPMISISSSYVAIERILLRFRVITGGEEMGVSSRACGGVDGGIVGNVDAGGWEEDAHCADDSWGSWITVRLGGEQLGNTAAGLTFSLGFGRGLV